MRSVNIYKILFFLLLVICFIYENKTRHFSQHLERRGLIEISPTHRKFAPAIRAWEKMIRTSDYSCDIAFFGNSLTNQSNFEDYFPNTSIANFGWGGNTLLDMYYRTNLIIASHPKKIFILGGTNDLFYVNKETLINRYERVVDALIDSLPNSKIYLQSILPFNHSINKSLPSNKKVKEVNDLIRQLAEQKHLTYINLYDIYSVNDELNQKLTTDGIHLRRDIGYIEWSKAISKYVEE